jgi:hypothetical protein
LDLNLLNLISIIKYNINIKGLTIDYKDYETYGDNICVSIRYDVFNLNVYNKEVPNNYSQALLQKNNLFDLGYNCDIINYSKNL